MQFSIVLLAAAAALPSAFAQTLGQCIGGQRCPAFGQQSAYGLTSNHLNPTSGLWTCRYGYGSSIDGSLQTCRYRLSTGQLQSSQDTVESCMDTIARC